MRKLIFLLFFDTDKKIKYDEFCFLFFSIKFDSDQILIHFFKLFYYAIFMCNEF